MFGTSFKQPKQFLFYKKKEKKGWGNKLFSSTKLKGWVTADSQPGTNLVQEEKEILLIYFREEKKNKNTFVLTIAASNSKIFAELSDKDCTDFNIRVLVQFTESNLNSKQE